MSELYPEYDPAQGKWFRRIMLEKGGYIKDYEPILVTTVGPIPQGGNVVVQRKESDRDQTEKVPAKIACGKCPFKKGMVTDCSTGCAWWTGSGCILTRPEAAESDSIATGGECPITRQKCLKTCAMRTGNKCMIVCKGDQE